jgi:HKD family nuclease
MLSQDLFEEILIKPAKDGADSLCIISGFVSPSLASRHIEALLKIEKHVKIKLIYGMFGQSNISKNNHLAFQHLASERFPTKFECFYVIKPPPIHSKGYAWYRENTPFRGFIGSMNYTQNGFSGNQREIATPCDASEIQGYFESLLSEAIDCREADAHIANPQKEVDQPLVAPTPPDGYEGLEKVTIELFGKKGNKNSGLNWGHREKYKRDRNQAYIRVPMAIAKTNFFPPVTRHFTVLTDDDKMLICTRAQQHAKAIHTPLNNALIGEYFRNRLGLASGQFVTVDDLKRYGRTSVDFYKIDDETYFMDFSLKKD